MDNSNTCSIERGPARTTLEFIAFGGPRPDFIAVSWPTAPGGVRRDALQRPELLHFAPDRWLAPGPTAQVSTLLAAAADAGAGVLVDATGKWVELLIAGPGAARLLASAIAVGAVLDRRGCAAVTLFDCPAILARQTEDFVLWVQASYAADFIVTAERFRVTLKSGA